MYVANHMARPLSASAGCSLLLFTGWDASVTLCVCVCMCVSVSVSHFGGIKPAVTESKAKRQAASFEASCAEKWKNKISTQHVFKKFDGI